jgi:hypothetical protein
LWRRGIELHNSGDNDDHDQQRIHCAYSDSDACAYTKSDSYANANTDPNADTRYSDDYVRR